MNYITEILAFNDLLLSRPLSAGQISLWYALMHINNKCGWAEWFSAPNRTLEVYTGLSRQGIRNAREALKQLGLIELKPNGKNAASYKLTGLTEKLRSDVKTDADQNRTASNDFQDNVQDSMQDTLHDNVQDSVQDSVQDTLHSTCTLNKQNKTKQNKTKIKVSKKEQKSYDDILNKHIKDEDLRDAYKEFIKMRQFIKKPMTDKALKTLIDKVNALEPESTERKIEMLNNAVLHNWLSVYPLDRGAGGNRQGAAEGSARNGESMQTNSQTSEWCTDKQWGGEQRSKFNNYEDTNKTDYAELEKILYEQMMRG